jgi:integrase
LGQINPEDFSGWRNQAMKDGVLKRSSATTINQHFDTVSAFCNWCVEKNRLRRNPLLHPNTNQPLIDKVKGAKVRQRRALSDDAVARVLAAASEYNRLVYLAALATGLRRAELEDLQWGDVRLNAIPGRVQLRAEATKANRADSIPLRSDLALKLRQYRPAEAQDSERVFPIVPPIEQWKADLMAARDAWLEEATTDEERAARNRSDFLKYKDAQGRQADFHGGTRKTLCTQMHRANVPLATAMRIMRHTDARLTMVDYCDDEQLDTLNAVEKVRELTDRQKPTEGDQKLGG